MLKNKPTSASAASRALAMLKNCDDLSLLQEFFNLDILSSEDSAQFIMNKKIECVRKLHTFAITAPSSSNGRWQTYVKEQDGSRKCIRAQSENELIQKLVSFYETHLNLDNIRFEDLFNEWLDHKRCITGSPNTILRHKQHYAKYFRNSILNNMVINEISDIFLEERCNELVRDNNISHKEWVNVKTILIGMFRLAMKKGYIQKNPVTDLKISVKYRQVNKKTGKTQTYNTDERTDLFTYLDEKYEETQDIVFMAAKFNFYLGMRVGELTALMWEDIVDSNHIHVVREETRNQETNITSVVPHTKTNEDRFVIIVPKAMDILNALPHYGEYIFTRSNGHRLKAKDVATVLEKYAKVKGCIVKSTHKIRKTYASLLNVNGVPLDLIREQLGHASLSTTLSYIYDPLTDEESFSLIEKAL